jgi:hypothetical protein
LALKILLLPKKCPLFLEGKVARTSAKKTSLETQVSTVAVKAAQG